MHYNEGIKGSLGMELIAIVSIIYVVMQLLKETFTLKLPGDCYANDELITKDRVSGMTEKEIRRNSKNKRYYFPKEIVSAYELPHRSSESSHNIIIENDQLYMIDYKQYGPFNIRKWMEQGKYNLNPEELKIRRLQIEVEYQRKHTRLENTEYHELCKKLDLVIASKQYKIILI